MLNSLSTGFTSAGTIVELAVRRDLKTALGDDDPIVIQVRAVSEGIHAGSDISCRAAELRAFASALASIQLGHPDKARLSADNPRPSMILVNGQGSGKPVKLSVRGVMTDHRIVFQIQDWRLTRDNLQDLKTWCATILGL